MLTRDRLQRTNHPVVPLCRKGVAFFPHGGPRGAVFLITATTEAADKRPMAVDDLYKFKRVAALADLPRWQDGGLPSHLGGP